MSYDEHDAAYDEWMGNLYREHREEAISEFTNERLQSYFLSYPLIAEPPTKALIEAVKLKEAGFLSASFLFAQIATETGVKAVLLKPMVSGLVHDAPTATLVSDLALSHTGLDRFRDLLFQTLHRIGGVDLSTYQRPISTRRLWDEITSLHSIRNAVVHRAEAPSLRDAETAIELATTVLKTIFPAVVKAVGLHLHEDVRICNDSLCALEGKLSPELLERMRNGKR